MTDQLEGMCPHGKIETAFCEPCEEEKWGTFDSNDLRWENDTITAKAVFMGYEQQPTGLHADYYDLPDNVKSAQDLIEYLNLNFANGNILKSLIRQHGTQTKATEEIYEAEKRYYFAERELRRVRRNQEVRRRLPDAAEGEKAP